MNDTHGSYTIRIKGHLGQESAQRFAGMTVQRTEDGETVLIGEVVDQAALHSLLRTIRDMGIQLLSVNPTEETQ